MTLMCIHGILCRKRKEADSGSGGPTPKSSGSEVGHEPKKRRGEATSAGSMPPVRLNPLIILSLREMHEVVRLFTNSPAGCVDWQMISDTATGGRVPAADVEYAANEFLPHVHYRPSIGQVVMERQSKIPSEYSKHRQTVKRMRHGLGPLLCKLKTYFIKDVIVAEDSSPSVGVEENASELKKRASLAIARLEKGDVPLYALRQAPVARIDGEAGSLSATGRVRKRYETKAMRLAKQAVEAESLNSVVSISTTSEKTEVKSEDPGTGQHFSVPPFFHATARQFAKSSSTSSVEE